MTMPDNNIAVVIPCYRVRDKILQVVTMIPAVVKTVYIVDDCCPEKSGEIVAQNSKDPRVKVIYLPQNHGVGGAVMAGYRAALADGMDIVVKIDGDGQMNPDLLPLFILPLLSGRADYVKGNRFSNPEDVIAMPMVRLLGNAILSFFTKLSSGYWDIFDPNNGYVAIHRVALTRLPLDKIDRRFFFESDMLFRLNNIGAVVEEVPMKAVYEDEHSNLRVAKVILPFLVKHIRNSFKRVIYNHFLRGFSLASLELLFGTIFLGFGLSFGISKWIESSSSGVMASPGTVMLAALPVLAGIQMILSFVNYDILLTPKIPLQKKNYLQDAALPKS